MFFVFSPAWDKEKILSFHEESNLRPSYSALRCSTTKPQALYDEEGLTNIGHLFSTDKVFLYIRQFFLSCSS